MSCREKRRIELCIGYSDVERCNDIADHVDDHFTCHIIGHHLI